MQKRILFCWELGANYGHLSRLIPVAEAQRAAGHVILFAINNIRIGEALLRQKDIAFVLAPLLQGIKSNQLAASYAELLMHCGYADKNNLLVAVSQWLELFQQFQPDLLVIDHSPTVLLSNKVTDIPAIQIGAGFEIPPKKHWPAILTLNDQQKQQLKQAELTLLNNMNTVMQQHHVPPLPKLTGLFDDCDQLLATFAELDHYQGREDAHYVGPIIYDVGGRNLTWSQTQHQKILVYVWPQMPGLNQLMHALSDLQCEVIAIVPNINKLAVKELTRPNIRIYDDSINIACLADKTDLLITHGIGTASILLRHAVPVLLVPKTLEHMMLGRCIEAHGLGLMMPPKRGRKDFECILARLLDTPIYREQAQQYAQKYQHVTEQDAINYITQVINHKLTQSPVISIV